MNSVHMGGLPQCMMGHHPPTPGTRHPPRTETPLEQTLPPPPDQAPPAQCMLGDTVNKRVVCILLEFNLVHAAGEWDRDRYRTDTIENNASSSLFLSQTSIYRSTFIPCTGPGPIHMQRKYTMFVSSQD